MSKLRKIKIANFAEEVGPGYENSYGQVTPFHVLFKDYGNQIAELPKDQAVEYVIKQIKELNNAHYDDPEYDKIPDHELKDLKEELLSADNTSGMDILFAIKDKLLASEGVGEKAEEDAPPQAPEEPAPEEPAQTEVQDQPEQAQPELGSEPVVEQPEQQNTQASLTKRLIKKQA